MNTEKIMEAIGEINDKYICEYAVIKPLSSPEKKSKRLFNIHQIKFFVNSFKRQLAVAFLCFAVIIGAISVGLLKEHNIQPSVPDEESDKTISEDIEMPALLFVNNKLYRFDRMIEKDAISTDSLIYLGTVKSSVSSGEIPTENFQSSCGIVGAVIYEYSGNIIVLNREEYELYTPAK